MNQDGFNVSVLDSLTEKYGEGRADRTASIWYMATGRVLNWEALSITNVTKFKKYMQNDLDFAQNTRAFYLALVRGAIADFYVLHDVSIRVYRALQERAEECEKCVLTKDEVNTLVNFEFAPPSKYAMPYQVAHYKHLLASRDCFCISCLTGLRMSDILGIDESNIVTQRGRNYLVYKAKKTKKTITIPASDGLVKLIQRGQFNLYKMNGGVYNSTIKEACQRAGIDAETRVTIGGKVVVGPKYKFVTTHTARRTFATMLYLSGVGIERICMYMGHSSIACTMKYIKMYRVEDKHTRKFLDTIEVND